MKALLSAGILVLASASAWGQAPPVCGTGSTAGALGTLTNYIALGAGGCTISDKTFFNFSIGPNATSVTTDQVMIAPDPIFQDPGIQVNPNLSVASGPGAPNVIQDLQLHFTVKTTNGSIEIHDVSLDSTGGFTFGGTTSINELVCVGGLFATPGAGTGCASGDQVVSLSVSNPPPVFHADQIFGGGGFPNLVNIVDVFKDIEVQSNPGRNPNGGSASLSSFSQHFSEVPEPMALVLFGSCLAFLAPWLRRRASKLS
jgi:hypothetical protein